MTEVCNEEVQVRLFKLKYQAIFKLGRGLEKSPLLEKELESHRLATTDITNVIDKCSAHVRRSVTDMKYTKVYQLMANSSRTCCSRQFPSSRMSGQILTGVLLGNCTAVNLSLLSHTVLSTLLILAVCRTRVTTNSVNTTSPATSLPVAQWLERPTGVTRGHEFDFPSGTQNFSLSHARDKLNIPSFSFLSELKIYHLSFFIITHGAFDIAEPSSMQDVCHNELSKYDLARHEFPSSSVVRAPDRCYGRSWVRFPSGNKNFSLSRSLQKITGSK